VAAGLFGTARATATFLLGVSFRAASDAAGGIEAEADLAGVGFEVATRVDLSCLGPLSGLALWVTALGGIGVVAGTFVSATFASSAGGGTGDGAAGAGEEIDGAGRAGAGGP